MYCLDLGGTSMETLHSGIVKHSILGLYSINNVNIHITPLTGSAVTQGFYVETLQTLPFATEVTCY